MKTVKIPAPSKIPIEESTILEGDAREVIERLPNASVQCAITSPPYWGLRDYGISGQIGLEESLASYLNDLTRIFSEVRRVLKPDGILWLNIGDGYTSGNRGWRAPDKKNPNRAMSTRPNNPPGLKDKELLGVPWRLAFALQADGWYLRSDIIWNKPNVMPESVKDRPTRAHEYLFMLTKSEQYRYHYDRVKETTETREYRNRRTVWNINTAPSNGGHIASFPEELVEPCVLASTQPGEWVLDPFFGIGTVGLTCQRLERHFIGIELNPEYVREAQRLLAQPVLPRSPHETIYVIKRPEFQPALLESASEHCPRTRTSPETNPANGAGRGGSKPRPTPNR